MLSMLYQSGRRQEIPPGSASILLASLAVPTCVHAVALGGSEVRAGRPWRWRASASKMLALPGGISLRLTFVLQGKS